MSEYVTEAPDGESKAWSVYMPIRLISISLQKRLDDSLLKQFKMLA